MSSSYWSSVYNKWSDRASGVNADNFYDSSFVDRLNNARQNLDNLVSEENQANSRVESSKDAYDTFKGQMRHYADVDEENENKFGVQTAFEQYEKSKEAVAATQSMIDVLPSNINANSNRILTQSQREAAFQRQYSETFGPKLSEDNNKVTEYEKAWEKARESATLATTQFMQTQQNTLTDFNKAWTNAIKNWREAQERVYTARQQYYDIQSQYRNWQNQQAAMERKRIMGQMDAALSQYIASLQGENTMRIADINARREASKNKPVETDGSYINNSGEYKYYDSRGNERSGKVAAYKQQIGNTIINTYVAPL